MSGAIYPGVGGVARKAKHIYVGVGGVARKVKRIYAGVGGVARLAFSSEVTVAVNGAPGETVSYAGEASGSVVLDSHGTYAGLVLDSGGYTFTGSVSGYSKAVTLSDDGTVNVYPDGAIFWYGNGDASGDSLYSKCGGWHFAKGAYPNGYGAGDAGTNQGAGLNGAQTGWSTYANHDGSTSLVGVSSETGASVSFSGYTNLKVICDSYEQNSGESGIWMCASNFSTAGAKTALAYLSLGNATKATKTLTLSGDAGYFCASATNARKYKEYGSEVWTECSSSNTIYAVWLE